MRWQSRCVHDLAWVEHGDQVVVYHRPSGQTHFLNASAALLLIEVLVRPSTLDEAAAALSERAGPPSPAMRERVRQLVLRFEELGLIERVRAA